MNLVKPEKLKQGDTIGIIATSGCVKNKENLFRAKKYFEKKGYKIVLSNNLFSQNRYLAGNDEERLEAIHDFFADSSVNAIICLRGGYGAIRLINKIDYGLINKNPKIFAGYSDISALSALFLKRAGLITYYAPMIQGDFGVENISYFSEKSFFDAVCYNKPLHYQPHNQKKYFNGNAKGLTFGGNLSTIVSLCGIDFIPDEEFIFFVEDLNEPVYKIDKMFTQLFNIEKFKNNIKGIVVGEFLNINNEAWLDEFFKELAEKYKKPMIGTFKITHGKDKLTIPYGENAQIENGKFIIDN